jgi:hypothetical protein
LLPEAFLGGRLRLQPQRSVRAGGRIAARVRLSREQAAEGIVRVVNASMERALRTISVERGHEPRDYTLIAFGGAAGQHACELAAALGVRRVIVPLAMPGILSGSVIVFALAASAFATPAIIGGRRLKVIATAAYDEFLNTLNWPLGASLAVLLLCANVVVLVASNRLIERRYRAVFRESVA